jgi:AbrB family looped-hinge helix DNA binding protein
MKVCIASKGRITIPLAIRERLGLKQGEILEFDESAPYLKATRSFDEKEMRSVIGLARGRLKKSSRDWLDETRGATPKRNRDENRSSIDRTR